jgi:uncharacterized protein (TIGR03086 family)
VTCRAPGRDLLREAIEYALPSADLVTAALLGVPTPCTAWNLGMLLSHLSESLDALAEGLNHGTVRLRPGPAEPDGEPAGMRVRFGQLLAAMQAAPADRPVIIAGHDMTETALTCTGAIEISVHGWDIGAACGSARPIPDDLARPLLRVAPALLPGTSRAGLFAEPLPADVHARPGERLLAFLGRASTWR